MNYRRYLPVSFQLSALVTLPWLVYMLGWQILPVVMLLSLIYHWASFSMGGHMLISHGRTSRYLPDWIFYTIFFYTTYITPHFWASQHIQHHKHPDTDQDPLSPDTWGWRVLLAFYPEHLTDKRTMVRHLRSNKLSQFFVKHYLWLIALPVLVFFWVPTDLFLLFYAVPASVSFSIATFSAYYSHCDGAPREKMPEWANILFSGESRYHKKHHENWKYCEPATEFLLKSDFESGRNSIV